MAAELRIPTDPSALICEESRALRAQAREAQVRARALCERVDATIQRAHVIATQAAETRRTLRVPIGGCVE